MVNQNVHFIGAGGSGMSALAGLSYSAGWKVTGCDQVHSQATQALNQLKIPIEIGHDPRHLDYKNTVVYSSAISQNHPELVYARKKGMKIYHRSEFLNTFLEKNQSITVAGSHGKTTTSALIAFLLKTLGADPKAIVGGIMEDYGTSFLYGKGPYMVVEADESDGTLLTYRQAKYRLLMNLDDDHMDYFRTYQNLVNHFSQYFIRTPEDGLSVICWDFPVLRDFAASYPSVPKISFGFHQDSEFRVYEYQACDGFTHLIFFVGKRKLRCRYPLIGRHNVLNVLAALSVVDALGLDLEAAAHALLTFRGVRRRLTCLHKSEELIVFDDYAHNPEKIQAALSSMKESWKNHRLIVLFQPHRLSRLQSLYKKFIQSFRLADLVLVFPVYTVGDEIDDCFSLDQLTEDISENSQTSSLTIHDERQAFKPIGETLQHHRTIILAVGAGDIGRFAKVCVKTFS